MAEDTRKDLYALLGPLPAREAALSCESLWTEDRGAYTLEKLVLRIDDESPSRFSEPIPAYMVLPKERPEEGKLPAILFCHSHGGRYELGKDELLLGNVYMYEEPYVDALVREGFAVLAFDAWCFGERRTGELRKNRALYPSARESEVFKDMLWWGEVLWGHMCYDGLRAFDYLAGRPEVDPERITTLGMSMGSTLSWWLAALEPRIHACIDLCCLTDFDTLAGQNGFDRHGLFYYVPGLRNSFTTTQINALIAPRPHLATVGIYDELTPVPGVNKIDRELGEIYEELGAEDQIRILRYPVAHQETKLMRDDVLAFLREYA